MCLGCAAAQTENLPEPTPLPQPTESTRVVLQGDWQKTGRAKLVLVSAEESSRISEAQVEATLGSDSGGTALTYKTDLLDDPSNFSLMLNQRLFDDVESFAQWQREGTDNLLSGGFASSLLGLDSLQLKHSQRISFREKADYETELSYSTPPVKSTRLLLQTVKRPEAELIKTELVHHGLGGLEVSATMKSKTKLEGELWGLFETPEIGGQLRWKW